MSRKERLFAVDPQRSLEVLQRLDNRMRHAVEDCQISLLRELGISVGSSVRMWNDSVYQITKIVPDYHPTYRSATITLYGIRLLGKGYFGSHEHYAGCLKDVRYVGVGVS